MKKELTLSTLGHTWILDIDGTVCKHNGYKIDGKDTILPGVKEFFDSLNDNDKVIFVTSRTDEFKDITISFLKENGLKYDEIIFNCPYGERVLINDNKPAGLVTGHAICLSRDEGLENIEINYDEKI